MKMAPRASTMQFMLLLMHAFLAFGTGILGNKASELFQASPSVILLGSMLFIILSAWLATALEQRSSQSQTATIGSVKRFGLTVPNRIVTMFPFAVPVGAAFGFVSAELLSPLGLPVIPRVMLLAWSYEIICFLFAIAFLLLLASFIHDNTLIITCAIGLSAGIASSLLLLHPEGNTPIVTTFSWLVAMIATALVVTTRTVRNAIYEVTKPRE